MTHGGGPGEPHRLEKELAATAGRRQPPVGWESRVLSAVALRRRRRIAAALAIGAAMAAFAWCASGC